uniref:Uncharacterized protein n=1 Tax=Plectus sambesii TaxID=2011161 RepID=A0A914VJ40_9BILA
MKNSFNRPIYLPNKGMLMRSTFLELCIQKGKVYFNQIQKLSSGTEELQIKGTQKHKIALEACIFLAEVCLSHMEKLRNGTKKPQNKETQMRSLI